MKTFPFIFNYLINFLNSLLSTTTPSSCIQIAPLVARIHRLFAVGLSGDALPPALQSIPNRGTDLG